jgi:ABC-type sugar transport system substrate-binding protein
MRHIRIAALAIVLAGAVASGPAFGQESAKSKNTKAAQTSDTSIATSVKNWTEKQWNAAKKEWEKDTAKWSSCRKQSDSKKLSGRASWSYLYECMKA